jgi:magnesium-protoporphyrin IX monomethyl ester (oxidative) cyclase
MAGFRKLALLQSHQPLQPVHEYYIADLVELCGLAAAVRDDVDDVTIPVAPTDRDPLTAFERFVYRHRPDLVGISAFTCGARSALDYAEIAARSGAFVLLGGYHPSALPDEALASPAVDAVVRGQGEATLLELVRSGSPEHVAGLSWKDDGRIVHNSDRPPADDLDGLPLPLREIRPPRFGMAGVDYHTDTIYASRGCRGRCVFCANHLVNGSWRGRRVESLFDELMTIPPPRRGPWKYVKFWDSIFLSDVERVERLCRLILSERLERHFRFIVETRLEDVIRAEPILKLMRRAGFVRIGVGVESPRQETHRDLRKGINLGQVARAAELVTAANMQLTKFLIVGHEGESERDVLGYSDWSLGHGSRLQNTSFFVMTPYPGTELTAEYERRGLIASRDWDLYTNFGAVTTPGGMTAARLQMLHAAVATRYGMARRFLLGKGVTGAVTRAFEPLMLMVKVGLARGDRTRTELAGDFLEALALSEGTLASIPLGRPSRGPAFRFHAAGRDSVVVGAIVRDGRQELVVRSGQGRLDGRKRELHVPVERLVDLASRIDYRRTLSEGQTLRLNPRAFRLAWLPGFARQLATVLGTVAGLVGFNLVVAIRGRRGAATAAGS